MTHEESTRGAHKDAEHDLFAVIAGRRSVKRFTPQPVEMDKILQVIQAGSLAPSSGNIQNWSFLIVTDTDKIRELYHHTLDQEPFLSAMAAVIVCGDVEYAHSMYGMRGKRLYTVQNCAAAIQNMLLAAHAVGLGACWIGAFDEDKVAVMFNIPSHRHRPQAILLFGYPAEEPDPKERKPLQDIVFFNKFGNKVLRPHLVFFDWATEWRNQARNVKEHAVAGWHRLRPKREERKEGEGEGMGRTGEMGNGEEPGADAAQAQPSPLERAREQVKRRLESLKRDEYRER